MPFKIVRNDITKMNVDVIVNTANEAPIYSFGTDTAVYQAAGKKELLAEREKIGFINEGDVAITPGFKLPARYIIHAVSPWFWDGKSGEEEKLRSCYTRSLELAEKYECKSIAFPLIATGSYGYPKEEGMRIALDEINSFLLKNDMLVYLVVFDPESTRIGQKLYQDLETYIDHNYVSDKNEEEYGDRYFGIPEEDIHEDLIFPSSSSCIAECPEEDEAGFLSEYKARPMASRYEMPKAPVEEAKRLAPDNRDEYYEYIEESLYKLDERMLHMEDSFQKYLMYLIEQKKLSNSEVYKRAIVTKQLFSKIKLNPEYHPDKATAMRLCVGAKLNLDETKDLLARAGYALSPCDKRDIIFSFFIEHNIFDMIEIDIALEEHGLPCFIE